MNGRTIDPQLKDEPYKSSEFLPDEKADLHSIDYIYRVVLAQEKKESQQATSEG